MALKIKLSDLQIIREALASEPVKIFARARWKHYLNAHGTPGNKFYQRDVTRAHDWDVFHYICDNTPGLLTQLYTYLNDDNIDAALRSLKSGK